MKQLLVAALLAIAPISVQAHDVTLDKPMLGATLDEQGVDLSVYWTAAENGAEVTATYVSSWDPSTPSRVRMYLQEGDVTTFAMPDARQVAFRFAFDGKALRVTAPPQFQKLASR